MYKLCSVNMEAYLGLFAKSEHEFHVTVQYAVK